MKKLFKQWFVALLLCYSSLNAQQSLTSEQKFQNYLQSRISNTEQDPPPPPCPNGVTEWNGTVWSNGLPTADKPVIFSGSFTSSTDMTACLVWVTNGATVTFSNASDTATPTLTVINEVTVDAGSALTFQNNTSLVQVMDNVVNSGNINYSRRTQLITKYDYTYWSSPVAGQNLGLVSPSTNPTTFYTWSPTANNWVYTNPASTTMDIGNGYIIRGPNGFDPFPSIHMATFTGVPNNGIVSVPLTASASNFNLIGNPFTSAVSADCFLNDAYNVSLGSLYFWTHNVPIDWSGQTPGNQTFNYNINDYAAYNLMGGVGTGVINVGSRRVTTNKPEGNIAACQGFFVNAVSSGNVVFKNGMRPTGNNSQFFKSTTPQGIISNCNTIDKSRLWIQIWDKGSVPDQFKQTLLGYSTQATTSATIDRLYDAPVFTANPSVDIYTLWNETSTQKLTIQGRYLGANFNVNEVIPLGFSCPASTEIEIRASDWDGLFDNQVFLLRETVSPGVFLYHDIRNSTFVFTTTTAITNNTTRFAIVFTAPNLTQISSYICGTIISDINQALPISINFGNAEMYRFNILNVNNANERGFREQTAPNNFTLNTPMTWLSTAAQNNSPFIRTGQTYEITVQARIGGIWFPAGNPCQVTVGSLEVKQTASVTCGGVVNANTQILMNYPATSSNPVFCRITRGDGVIRTLLFSSWQLKFNNFWPTIINAGATPFFIVGNNYTIEFCNYNTNTNSAWENYGTPCTLTMVTSRLTDIFEATAYPNPFKNDFILDIQSSSHEDIYVQVFDLLGKTIEFRTIKASEVNDKISFGDNYSKGVYTLIVNQGEDKKVIKMVKQ